jgi:hypothetical protein
MSDELWMLLAEAAKFLGPQYLPGRIKGMGMRGVRPGESTLVEIPASEVKGLRINWVHTSLTLGRLGIMYQNVQMRWADAKRLAQADVRLLLAMEAQTPPSTREGASNADISEAKAGPLVKEVALELRRIFPKGRPALRNAELMERVKKAAGEKLGVFSLRTLERAIALAWPGAKRQREPKAGNAHQI